MWVKLDDRFYMHPKVLATSLEGIGLFALGLSYAGGYETDGMLSHSLVSVLTRNRLELVTELVRNGLWIANETGYEIHDFLKYNPSKAVLVRERKAAKKRMKAIRGRSGEHRPNQQRTPGRVGSGPIRDLVLVPSEQGKVRKGATILDPELPLTDERRAYATQAQLDADLEWAEFHDHFAASGRRYLNWDATWRNWCRRAWKFKQRR